MSNMELIDLFRIFWSICKLHHISVFLQIICLVKYQIIKSAKKLRGVVRGLKRAKIWIFLGK